MNQRIVFLNLAFLLTLPPCTYAATTTINPGESIQDAIVSATHGDEIVVLPGRYVETIDFEGKDITIRSATPEDPQVVAATILDGSRSGTVVTFNNQEGRQAILSGISVTGGLALVGGGILIDDASPVISNCQVSGNSTPHSGIGGGGAGVYCLQSYPVFMHCSICENSSHDDGGGMHCERSVVSLVNCQLCGNDAHDAGGGLFCRYSQVRILNGALSGNRANSGGGLNARDYSSLHAVNCLFQGNNADDDGGGIRLSNYCEASLRNCVFTGNSSVYSGSAILASHSSRGSMRSSTIAHNETGSEWAVLRCHNLTNWSCDNCIFWGNTPWEIKGNVEVSNSNVEGGWTRGTDNIEENPLFVDFERGDYRLAVNSPCIDTGSNHQFGSSSSPNWALGDLAQNVRAWDGDGDGIPTIDMGAYEFGPPPYVGDLDGDNKVGYADIMEAELRWKTTPPPMPVPGDQNGDNQFDVNDLMIVLRSWGTEN